MLQGSGGAGASTAPVAVHRFGDESADGASRRALWDTPGLPRDRSYESVLPDALAAPLVRPPAGRERVRAARPLFVAGGESVVLTCENVFDDGPGAAPPLPLARIDVLDVSEPPPPRERPGRAAAPVEAMNSGVASSVVAARSTVAPAPRRRRMQSVWPS